MISSKINLMLKSVVVILFLLQSFSVVAQKTITIKGTVVAESDREPIIGAIILVKGTSIGTSTDLNGEYTLSIPETTKSVEISYLGMTPVSMPFNKDKINDFRFIEMRQNTEALSEVVVVGFGTQKKESVIGAIQTVKPKDLIVPSSSLTSAFAGKIAGVIAVQRSGEPGADGASFWIRGISTFSGPTSPLIVLDGVEITTSELNSIAPESIESFSVLKDATATSLYGTKGANGVMVVTTKSGKDMDKPQINVRVEQYMTQSTQLPKFANGVTYMKLYNEAQLTRNPNATPTYSEDIINGTENNLNPYIYPNVDWYGLLFKNTSQNQSANLNVTGGSKKVNYFINVGFFNENGMYKNNSFNAFENSNIRQQKISFQNNINAQLTKTTKIGLRMMTQIRNYDGPGVGSDLLFSKAFQTNPVEFPPYFPADADSKHIYFGNKTNYNVGNPLAFLLTSQKNEFESSTLTAFNLNQDLDIITKGLSFRALASFQYWSQKATKLGYDPFFYEITSYNPDNKEYVLSEISRGTESIRVLENNYNVNRTINLQAFIEYNRTFAKKHNVSGMLSYHQRDFRKPSDNIYGILPYREQGLAGRVTYDYNTRYFAELNFGYNGSENFKKGMRYGFFPAITAGYTISNENYFKLLTPIVNLLKIRGSYGLAGNSNTEPRFPYLTEVHLNDNGRGYTFGDQWNNSLNGISISKYGQDGATWETGKKSNIGIEIGLFNKLTIIADAFNEIRSGIFMQRRVVPTTIGIGGALPYANIGVVQNSGYEMSMEFNHSFNSDFIITAKSTITYAANKLLNRDEPKQLYAYQSEIGQPLNYNMGLIADGLYTEQDIQGIANGTLPNPTFTSVMAGDIKYKDLNGDNKIDNFDRTFIGNPNIPQLVYGFGGSLKYKKIDFSVFFQGVGKTSVMIGVHPFGNYKYQVYDFVAKDHWTESNPNPNAAYPRLSDIDNSNNMQGSSFWIRDASFLRLKNAEIGFTYKFMRAYVNGSNLLTFSKFKYWDPEVGSSGTRYPTLKVINVGIQMTFN
jgi:TonB-linked SusC/RagA family outer membrane protein